MSAPKTPTVYLSANQAHAVWSKLPCTSANGDASFPDKDNACRNFANGLTLRKLPPKFRKGKLAYILKAPKVETLRSLVPTIEANGRKVSIVYCS